MNLFKISISSSNSPIRFNSRASSLADATSPAGALFSDSRTQVPSEVSEIPNSLATSLIGRPEDRYNATASRLNSPL